ncbi:unnamed protein product [Toxocara canis]|uniref:Uncharacterized protein n=1 Tax=Toxocara canis TaxID=6265 RepID=A0A3P7FJQ7_TOXCA|nr:unnamed protein product [Toxocara canis]
MCLRYNDWLSSQCGTVRIRSRPQRSVPRKGSFRYSTYRYFTGA